MKILVFLLLGVMSLFLTGKFIKSFNQQSNITKSQSDNVYRTDFAEVKEILNSSEHLRESIVITPLAKKPDNIRSSRFGGNPYWPLSMDYPVDKKTGNELYLIAQLNLAELPKNKQLPPKGILQFYISSDDLMGLEFPSKERSIEAIISESTGYRVIYHKDIDINDEQLRTDFPMDDRDMLPIEGEYALSFQNVSQKPSPSDINFENIIPGSIWDFADDQVDSIFDEYTGAGSRIGGYAYFTQEDPRSLKHVQWKLLFQMDTANQAGVNIMWGDSGVANFFIEDDKLQKLDFSKVWYNWDCH